MASRLPTSLAAWIVVGIAFGHWESYSAYAGLSYPRSDATVSPDGRFILVNICPNAIEEELEMCSDDSARKVRSLRATYPYSGLYRNDGSSDPLWTYEGQWVVNPIIAPDGRHVVFEGDWTWNEHGLYAVEFTRNGNTIRTYSSTEIIPQWTFKAILNGWTPPSCEGTYFDSEYMTYTIRTNQREEITFDVTTGDIIHVESPFPEIYGMVLASAVAVVGVIVYWWRKHIHDYSPRAAPSAPVV